jgi:predicted enzyme related to lactoylglutathione lyase
LTWNPVGTKGDIWILVNFEPEDVEGEFQRIKELGAKVIAESYHPGEAEDMMLATFEDPDSNFFQLASPFKLMN